MHDIGIGEKDLGLDIFSQEKRQSATELVISTIKKLLITKKLKPGDKLPSEFELSESLGVSRGSIRESMKILSAYGIVNIRRGDGTYISETTNQVLFDPLLFRLIINHEDFVELEEFREVIELSIIRLAIKNAEEDDIKNLENAYNYMKVKIKTGEYDNEIIAKAEQVFHEALGKSTHNRLVQEIYNFLLELYIPNIIKNDSDEEFGNEALTSHRPIIDAIVNKDYAAGEKAIKDSLNVWRHQYNKLKSIE